MTEIPNYYSLLPANVRYDEDLKPNEKLLYSEITSLTQKDGTCWASNRYFSDLYKVSIETVSRWINNLKKKGYIEIKYEYKGNTKEIEKRVIIIAYRPLDKIINTPCENNQYPLDKKVKGNNTSINNTSINTFSLFEKKGGEIEPIKGNQYQDILEHWNEQKIVVHKKMDDTTKNKIKKLLTMYSEDEIKQSFVNYKKIISDDMYWFNYKWNLRDFLSRGIEKFIDWDICSNNYKNDKMKRNDKNGGYDSNEQITYKDAF